MPKDLEDALHRIGTTLIDVRNELDGLLTQYAHTDDEELIDIVRGHVANAVADLERDVP